ncbi:Gfo/Idh/MocA family oxidoreductase [Campylobacter pinnipediorum]|uniref:Gfo/Idh/MocA family oxidoreductase n=1 Tax=Campylobacter pinnipediorum TaxID=1965231 RepID=UPI000994B6EE|nr:Gfo/Idh/MocA family oxidoreductase [Campylobacter pinnipediorum]AQW82331.1 oxidoreductase, Gfo/Idh/MocA family [Campylobacter pinnipediorum subsp. pinnipediorum]
MKLKVGIVGFTDIGKAHYSELRRFNKIEVCGIFDEKEHNEYSRVEFYNDFKKFIQDSTPEVLLICVDQSDVLDAFLECLKHAKTIIIASPICRKTDDLRQIRYSASVNKINLTFCLRDRFNPVICSLRKALCKEDEIYSIDIFHSKSICSADMIDFLSVLDIDLIKHIIKTDLTDFISMSRVVKDEKYPSNTQITFKTKTQILVNILNSTTNPLDQFNIRISTNNGIYFADLLNFKLYQTNINGQINLKVDKEENELKKFYNEFCICYEDMENKEVISIDEIIKIKELFK